MYRNLYCKYQDCHYLVQLEFLFYQFYNSTSDLYILQFEYKAFIDIGFNRPKSVVQRLKVQISRVFASKYAFDV